MIAWEGRGGMSVTGWRQKAARVIQGILWVAAIAGLALTITGGAGDPSHMGTLAAVLSAVVLITLELRKRRQPPRDDILAQQVARSGRLAEEALAEARSAKAEAGKCGHRTEELITLMAQAAQAAEIASPDTEATLPRLRIVGDLQGRPQALAV
jgi:hypothetical protein